MQCKRSDDIEYGLHAWMLTNADNELSVGSGVAEAEPAPLHGLAGLGLGGAPPRVLLHIYGSVQQLCATQAACPLHRPLPLKLHMQPSPRPPCNQPHTFKLTGFI